MAGFVYVAEADGRVKIGWTAYPENRFAKLEREIGEEVLVWACVPGTRADERRYHKLWRRLALGNEWFRTSPRLLKWAEELDAAEGAA